MRMDEGGAAGPDPAEAAVAGAVTGAILDRLDSIGRLLAEGAAAGPRRAAPGSNLVNRIDMLGRIVEQVLAEREADEARLAALARRIVDLEAGLAPALAACADRLDAALPLLAGPALDPQPGARALALLLADLRERLDRLARGTAPPAVASPLAPRGAVPTWGDGGPVDPGARAASAPDPGEPADRTATPAADPDGDLAEEALRRTPAGLDASPPG